VPLLCYVTDRLSLPCPPGQNSIDLLLRKIEEASRGGVNWIQIREKDLSGRDSAALTREALSRASENFAPEGSRTRILVNDRLDVALAGQAGGVHLGENSISVAEAKSLVRQSQAAESLGDNFLVGASCHSLDVAESAASEGADYIFFGPVFATPSKAAYGDPPGLARLAEVCRSVNIPVLAIGGITLLNSASCIAAGASGIAAIRLFQDSTDPASLLGSIREQLA
jgi:thiamine-phosphate pyrophosphorylase